MGQGFRLIPTLSTLGRDTTKLAVGAAAEEEEEVRRLGLRRLQLKSPEMDRLWNLDCVLCDWFAGHDSQAGA